MIDESSEQIVEVEPVVRLGDRVIMFGGYALILTSVFCFAAVAFVKLRSSLYGERLIRYENWLDFLQSESPAISLIVIAIIAASLGKRLVTTVPIDVPRTIPYDDLPLIRQAVIDGKSEPVDQYVRLRTLSGISGTFYQLGITGLPLTTVVLTLIFSTVALFPIDQASNFLDLAKLTLGAFIGSFVQYHVEQRRQESQQGPETAHRPDSLADRQ
jgi:hypothetical protein